jgi:hypothetical protein
MLFNDCCSFTFSLSNTFGFSALFPCFLSQSLSPPKFLFFRFIAFKCIRLFVAFTSDYCSFRLFRHHTRLLFVAITSNRCSFALSLSNAFVSLTSDSCSFRLFRHRTRFLFVAFASDCCSFALSLSNAFVSLSLSPPTIAPSVSSDTALAFSLSLLLTNAFGLSSLFSYFFSVAFTADCCSFGLFRHHSRFLFSVSLPNAYSF